MIFLKFPFQPEIFTVQGPENEFPVKLVSFDETETVRFGGKLMRLSNDEILSSTFPRVTGGPDPYFRSESKEEYLERVAKVIQFVRKNEIPKLVLSRQKYLPYSKLSGSGEIDFGRSFLNLCGSYPNAFVYLFNKGPHCWMGAFSELLGRFNKKTSVFETMSLAGTLPLEEDWTDKEREEQRPVTLYIAETVQKYSSEVWISETYDHHSGNIKHLRTDFKAKVKKDDLKALIAELHPTPAVCGIPKDFCQKAIAAFEKNPRSFYSGYIRVETESEIQYFVNLRCARFTASGVHLYAGGGINGKSDPEKEWQETELKAGAVLNNLAVTDAT